ncbi:unnamed protein product, partial [Sphacelaria rigidula]
MVKEVICALRSILSEQRRPVSEWVDVLPAAQWALNTSFRVRYRNTPYCVMRGRAPRTAFSALVSVTGSEWNVAQGQAVLPKFAVGDFVLYARVRRQDVMPKLMCTWTGPW